MIKSFKKFNSDKIKHGYIEIYSNYLSNLKNKKLKILEIGVADGKSILSWSDYFKKSLIIGMDIKKLNLKKLKSIIKCIVAGCKQYDCELVGGETAEMPGTYEKGKFDITGFAVGIVGKNKI